MSDFRCTFVVPRSSNLSNPSPAWGQTGSDHTGMVELSSCMCTAWCSMSRARSATFTFPRALRSPPSVPLTFPFLESLAIAPARPLLWPSHNPILISEHFFSVCFLPACRDAILAFLCSSQAEREPGVQRAHKRVEKRALQAAVLCSPRAELDLHPHCSDQQIDTGVCGGVKRESQHEFCFSLFSGSIWQPARGRRQYGRSLVATILTFRVKQ